MPEHNGFKSALLFLAIILLGLISSMFLEKNELFVKENSTKSPANVLCITSSESC